jgi:hypothetical protein
MLLYLLWFIYKIKRQAVYTMVVNTVTLFFCAPKHKNKFSTVSSRMKILHCRNAVQVQMATPLLSHLFPAFPFYVSQYFLNTD